MASPEGQEDRDYWNTKYAEASCHKHEGSDMWFDADEGEWVCEDCEDEDELTRAYRFG